jgi:hypothetical protein
LAVLLNTNGIPQSTNYLDAIGLGPTQKFYRVHLP